MYDNSDYSGAYLGGGCRGTGRYKLCMNISALSVKEQAYVLGLYLTDGYMRRCSKSTHLALFSLQGDESAIAGCLVEMFRRSGLKPYVVVGDGGQNTIRVQVVATNIAAFLPDKKKLLDISSDEATGWLRREGLEGEFALPFIGGLLDGDGYCGAGLFVRNRGLFGMLWSKWSFTQRNYRFLVDYVARYVNKLVRRGATLSTVKDGRRAVEILSSGREALLQAGFAKCSFKVTRFLGKQEDVKRRVSNLRSQFYTASQAGCELQVHAVTVRKWCRQGRMKHLRVRGTFSKKRGYNYLIPVDEVYRLKRALDKSITAT